MDKVLEIRRKIASLLEEMRGLNDKAETEKRDFTEDETNLYNTKKGEVESLRAQEQRHIELHGLEDEARDKKTVIDEINERGGNQNQADEKRWGSFGEFLQAVMKAGTQRGVDERLVESRITGMNETVPSEGGFLVQTQHIQELITKTFETGMLANRVRRIPVAANANGITINAVDDKSRATGSRWGGVQAFWQNEGGIKTKSQPSFRQMELKLKKLTGLVFATDELMQDTVALGSIINQAFPEEFAFMIDNAIYEGDGVGKPLGITKSNALITVAKETGQAAKTILFENIVAMWSRMWARSRANSVWVINQDIEPALMTMSLAVGTGGVPVYLPANGAAGSPFASLMGRPVLPIEHASTLGTAGDITLADFSQYLMIDKGGLQTASSIHVKFEEDETAFRFVWRTDGQPVWDQPLTPFKGSNTQSPFVTLATRA